MTRNASFLSAPRAFVLSAATALLASLAALPATAQARPACTPSGWVDFQGDLSAAYVGKCPQAGLGETAQRAAPATEASPAARPATQREAARPQGEREVGSAPAKTSQRSSLPAKGRLSHDGFVELGGDSTAFFVGLPADPERAPQLAQSPR